MSDRIETEALRDSQPMFLLMKRGLYWRPEAKGYTGLKDEAGRYTLEDCAGHFPNTDSPNQDSTSFIAEDDAPDYAPSCCEDIRRRHTQARIIAVDAENTRLRAALDEAKADEKAWMIASAILIQERDMARAELAALREGRDYEC